MFAVSSLVHTRSLITVNTIGTLQSVMSEHSRPHTKSGPRKHKPHFNRLPRESRSTIAPQLFFNEIAGLEISSRPYLLKYGAPCHPDTSLFDGPLQTRKYMGDFELIAPLLMLSSHDDAFVKQKRWFLGGAVVELFESLRPQTPVT